MRKLTLLAALMLVGCGDGGEEASKTMADDRMYQLAVERGWIDYERLPGPQEGGFAYFVNAVKKDAAGTEAPEYWRIDISSRCDVLKKNCTLTISDRQTEKQEAWVLGEEPPKQ